MIETIDAEIKGLLDRLTILDSEKVVTFFNPSPSYFGYVLDGRRAFITAYVEESIARNADKIAVSIGFNRSGSEGQWYCAIECRESGRFYAATHKEMAIGLLSAWVQYLESDRMFVVESMGGYAVNTLGHLSEKPCKPMKFSTKQEAEDWIKNCGIKTPLFSVDVRDTDGY